MLLQAAIHPTKLSMYCYYHYSCLLQLFLPLNSLQLLFIVAPTYQTLRIKTCSQVFPHFPSMATESYCPQLTLETKAKKSKASHLMSCRQQEKAGFQLTHPCQVPPSLRCHPEADWAMTRGWNLCRTWWKSSWQQVIVLADKRWFVQLSVDWWPSFSPSPLHYQVWIFASPLSQAKHFQGSIY